jgi:spore maturation protein CgeB
MDPLARNLAALRERCPEQAQALLRCAPDPGVELRTARSGALALCAAGRLETSLEDPQAEGRELAAHLLARAREAGARRLVVLGLGIHALEALAQFEGELLIVEPSAALARAALERIDVSAALRRCALLLEDDPERIARHPVFAGRERGLLLAHPAARRRAGALYDALLRRFRAGGETGALDIAVIPPLYGGSLPVARACARALRELGQRVRDIDLEVFWPAYQRLLAWTADARLARRGEQLRAALVRLIGEALLAAFELDPPDLVLALAQAPLDAHALAGLQRRGIARALWFCEDFRVMTYWPGLARAYDLVFHLQPGEFGQALRDAGGQGHPLRMAFDPMVHHFVSLAPDQLARYAYDLSFVGAAYHNRVQFLPALVPLGLRIYGTGWPPTPPFDRCMPEPGARQSPEASNLIFNASAINLNLHSSPWVDGVNPAGDYLNPRTFELAGARAFQLVDARSDLAACFQPGAEIETFADLEECRRKIRHYLGHPDERREIAARAQRRALAEHTYRHRMQEALDVLRSGAVALAPRRCGSSVGAALDAAAGEPELRRILGRLDPDLPLDAEALAAAVRAGTGPLSREEKLLLYLREARREVVIREAREAA